MEQASGDFDWNDTARVNLQRLWAEGRTTAEISRLMGCGKNAVIGKARRMGLPPRRNPVKIADPGQRMPRSFRGVDFTYSQKARVRELWPTDVSFRAICRDIGMDEQAARKRIKNMDLPPRKLPSAAQNMAPRHTLPRLASISGFSENIETAPAEARPQRSNCLTRQVAPTVHSARRAPANTMDRLFDDQDRETNDNDAPRRPRMPEPARLSGIAKLIPAANPSLLPSVRVVTEVAADGGVVTTMFRPSRKAACVFPMWGDRERPTGIYCDAQAVAFSSYCACHYERVHKTAPKTDAQRVMDRLGRNVAPVRFAEA